MPVIKAPNTITFLPLENTKVDSILPDKGSAQHHLENLYPTLPLSPKSCLQIVYYYRSRLQKNSWVMLDTFLEGMFFFIKYLSGGTH